MTIIIRKKYNYKKIRLFAKIRLLGRNSKFRSDEDTPRCLEVLHAEVHDAPTLNKKGLVVITTHFAKAQKKIVCLTQKWVSGSKFEYFFIFFYIHSLGNQLGMIHVNF